MEIEGKGFLRSMDLSGEPINNLSIEFCFTDDMRDKAQTIRCIMNKGLILKISLKENKT